MQKMSRAISLSLIAVTVMLLTPRIVASQVGRDALKDCEQLAFSTEEDFVSQVGEIADGNPIVSDGDLLGIVSDATGLKKCVICARNADLFAVAALDVTVDLGLDAADVIDSNPDVYLVAFSTELDSPNQGQFTAGDLLVTNGAIIPNGALMAAFWQINSSLQAHDVGLDAVHFKGEVSDIKLFLDAWPGDQITLAELLRSYQIDIWFSIEGTVGPVLTPTLLDGDLVSALNGTKVIGNDGLLPASVPAGIPVQGVDFGLDAVTTDRLGTKDLIHFSTEILYGGRPSFTDGDVLEQGNGVAMTNEELLSCFAPAKEANLGLDALSVGIPEEGACESKLTHVAGVSLADIDPVSGMALPGTVGSPAIGAPVPFGGWLDIEGSICEDVEEFRVLYRQEGSTGAWTPIPVLSTPTLTWTIQTDAFIPPFDDCLGTVTWASDSDGWFDGADYRHYTLATLEGCNPGLALTVWESGAVPTALGGPEGLHDLVLETKVASVVYSDTVRRVQLDNTWPTAELEKTPGECLAYDSSDMPLTVTGRISDTHFYNARLRLTGDGYGWKTYPTVAYYDDLGDNLIETGTVSWDAFVDLGAVTVFDLAANPVECGYTVILTAWDRTLSCSFNFENNQAYHCPGCRHDGDAWTFNYTTTP